ncbi:MAG: hypothetical protein KDM91_22150 [Verrucomicrobiae bacterium]|nr:hypothetical protein [Verrucomicrobiae bacterium]
MSDLPSARSRFRDRRPGFALPARLIASLLMLASACVAQEGDDYRQFTDKEGRRLEARIVQAELGSPKMKIEMRDGRQFDLDVVTLSLDDQQFVRDWLKRTPTALVSAAAATDFRLEVTLDKIEKRADSGKDDFYRYEVSDVSYRVSIKNLSRETLPPLTAEFRMIYREGIELIKVSSRSWSWSSVSEPKDTVFAGMEAVPGLPFNYAHTFDTGAMKVERIRGDGNLFVGEDETVGAMVRLVDEGGREYGLYRSSDPGIGAVTWPAQGKALPVAP